VHSPGGNIFGILITIEGTEMTLSSALASHDLGAVVDALAQHNFHAVMVTRAEAKTPIVYVNDAFAELTGYSIEETLGKSPGFLQGPATDERVLGRLREDMSTGRVFEGQAINYRKDGSAFTMHWRVVPIKDAAGKPLYFIAFQQKSLSE
jgi:PAS domain S-box-containing protein